jgi:hypothetical protein
MTNEQILEQQVEALEKLLQLKQAVIEELESKVQKLQYPPLPYSGGGAGVINLPSVWTVPPMCTDGLPHQYPSMWGGTSQPSCTKCGQYPSIFNSGAGVITTTSGGASGITINPYQGAVGQGSAGGGTGNVSTYTYADNGAQGYAGSQASGPTR